MEGKTPSIRFKGFTEEWEKKKLGSLGSTYNGLSGKTKDDFGHGDAEYITYMNIFLNPLALRRKTEKTPIDNKQNEVRKGDILFTTSSETPEEVGMSSVWIYDANNVYLNSFCFGFRPNININNFFFAYNLRSPFIRRQFILLAQGISRYNISKNKAMDIWIKIPSLKEQEKIGTLFSKFDQLLELKNRELAKIETFKKSMLDKMFPKEGEVVPEIRFSGFTEDWEEKKLGDTLYYERPDNYIVESTEYINKGIPVLTANKGFILGYTDEENIYNKGQAIIIDDFTLDCKFVDFSFMVKSSALKILTEKPGYDLSFLYELLQISNIPILGHARHYISVVQKHIVKIPSLKEQELIGDFFNKLDQKIELKKAEIEKLEDFKSSLLEKMFI